MTRLAIPMCRAKAGGRQSTQDNTGKFAKSAGSQIRRYNEVRPAQTCCLTSPVAISLRQADSTIEMVPQRSAFALP